MVSSESFGEPADALSEPCYTLAEGCLIGVFPKKLIRRSGAIKTEAEIL
jgi:hypothetical protein